MQTIADCRWSMIDHQVAKPRAKPALRLALVDALNGAIGEREVAAARLRQLWSEPDDDACLAMIGEYTAWCDLVRDLCRDLGQGGDRCRG